MGYQTQRPPRRRHAMKTDPGKLLVDESLDAAFATPADSKML
jgi:hypothetical protein